MSLRLEMLQAARSSPILLPESPCGVERFLRGQLNADGGFSDRSGRSDLYYTVFGLEGLLALGAEVPANAVRRFLGGFGAGETLDLVHLACLVRCWADLGDGAVPGPTRRAILRGLERFRSADGGYDHAANADRGTAYGCFLAFGAREDMQDAPVDAEGLVRCLESLKTRDGAYGNDPGLSFGTTPATAAAVTLLRRVNQAIDPGSVAWLLARHVKEGGFLAVPDAPLPDLLSTATALHALAAAGAPLREIRRPCLDFLRSLWCRQGGFCGNRLDRMPDCEYTWYALLALGHLARCAT